MKKKRKQNVSKNPPQFRIRINFNQMLDLGLWVVILAIMIVRNLGGGKCFTPYIIHSTCKKVNTMIHKSKCLLFLFVVLNVLSYMLNCLRLSVRNQF